jgi:hypothetical protein
MTNTASFGQRGQGVPAEQGFWQYRPQAHAASRADNHRSSNHKPARAKFLRIRGAPGFASSLGAVARPGSLSLKWIKLMIFIDINALEQGNTAVSPVPRLGQLVRHNNPASAEMEPSLQSQNISKRDVL